MDVYEIIEKLNKQLDAAVANQEFYLASVLRDIRDAIETANDKPFQECRADLLRLSHSLFMANTMVGGLLSGKS